MSRDYVGDACFLVFFAFRKPFCTVVWPPFIERNAEENAKDRAIASHSRRSCGVYNVRTTELLMNCNLFSFTFRVA